MNLRSPYERGSLALILLGYALFLWLYFVPVYAGTDPNGYHVSASRLASRSGYEQHGRFHRVPADDYVFVGRMWVVNARGEYYPKYPPRYPAFCEKD